MHGQSQNISHLPIFFRIYTKYTPSLVALLSANLVSEGKAQEAARLGIYIIINNHSHHHPHHTTIPWRVFTLCVVGTTPARTPTSVIPGEHKSSCKPYLVAFLQKGTTINPFLWPNVFKLLHKGGRQKLLSGFFPLRGGHPPIPLRKKR